MCRIYKIALLLQYLDVQAQIVDMEVKKKDMFYQSRCFCVDFYRK